MSRFSVSVPQGAARAVNEVAQSLRAPLPNGLGDRTSSVSPTASVLLLNVRMIGAGGFYRRGTKRHERAVAGTRELAGAIIAVGC